MKKQIIYLSPDCFFDTDALVLRHLAAEYDVTWVALVTVAGSRVSNDSVVETIAQNAGVKLVLKHLRWRKFSWQQLRFNLGLLRELKAHKADMVYIEDIGDLFFYLLQPLFLKQKTSVFALHDVVTHLNPKDLRSKMQVCLFNITRSVMMGWAQNFHIFSRTEYKKFKELYPLKSVFYTRLLLKSFGPPAVDTLLQTTQRPGSISGCCRFLFFGLISYYKGLDVLIEALETLVREGFTNFSLTIAGNGSYWPQCETLIRSTPHYELLIRYIADEEIPELFTRHHFLVLPYRDASQSGPQMISLEYTLPVIAAEIGGLSDFIVNEQTGFLFRHNAEQASHTLTHRLRQSLTMSDHQYEEMRQRLGEWKQQHYSIDDTIARYIQFFNEKMGGNI